MKPPAFGALRRLASTRIAEPERCELCAAALPERHQHLADPANRRLLCACDACAILFSDNGRTKFKRVPRDSYVLEGFTIEDQAWSGLGIPTGLVFFFESSAQARVMAFYPSPAGPTEAEIDPGAWDEIIRDCARLRALASDVEALLVNRMNGARDAFVVPIDQCYILTGLIRKYWHGFSGGEQAQEALNNFFNGLRQRSSRLMVSTYAGS